MLWFGIWTVIVLATLTGAFFLGRSVWRSARALMREASKSAAALDAMHGKIEELTAARGPARVFRPDLMPTDDQRATWRATRAANLQSRADRVRARRARTLARWRSIGIPF